MSPIRYTGHILVTGVKMNNRLTLYHLMVKNKLTGLLNVNGQDEFEVCISAEEEVNWIVFKSDMRNIQALGLDE